MGPTQTSSLSTPLTLSGSNSNQQLINTTHTYWVQLKPAAYQHHSHLVGPTQTSSLSTPLTSSLSTPLSLSGSNSNQQLINTTLTYWVQLKPAAYQHHSPAAYQHHSHLVGPTQTSSLSTPLSLTGSNSNQQLINTTHQQLINTTHT